MESTSPSDAPVQHEEEKDGGANLEVKLRAFQEKAGLTDAEVSSLSTECKNVMCGVLTDSNNKFEIWMEYIQLCFKTGRFGSARDTLTKAVSALSGNDLDKLWEEFLTLERTFGDKTLTLSQLKESLGFTSELSKESVVHAESSSHSVHEDSSSNTVHNESSSNNVHEDNSYHSDTVLSNSNNLKRERENVSQHSNKRSKSSHHTVTITDTNRFSVDEVRRKQHQDVEINSQFVSALLPTQSQKPLFSSQSKNSLTAEQVKLLEQAQRLLLLNQTKSTTTVANLSTTNSNSTSTSPTSVALTSPQSSALPSSGAMPSTATSMYTSTNVSLATSLASYEPSFHGAAMPFSQSASTGYMSTVHNTLPSASASVSIPQSTLPSLSHSFAPSVSLPQSTLSSVPAISSVTAPQSSQSAAVYQSEASRNELQSKEVIPVHPKLTLELLMQLSEVLQDPTIFEIVRSLESIQILKEKEISRRRAELKTTQRKARADLLQLHRQSIQMSTSEEAFSFIQAQNREQLKQQEAMFREETDRFNKWIADELNALTLQQQTVLQEAGVPAFYPTQNRDDIQLQTHIIKLILAIGEREHSSQQSSIDQTHQSSQQQQLQPHQLQQLMQAPAEYSGNTGNIVNSTEHLLSMPQNNFNQINTESAPQVDETELLALLQQYHSLQSYPNTSLYNTWST